MGRLRPRFQLVTDWKWERRERRLCCRATGTSRLSKSSSDEPVRYHRRIVRDRRIHPGEARASATPGASAHLRAAAHAQGVS